MQSSTCWVWGFVAQILQPEPLPFTLERLHSSLQRRKIDLANRQSGSKVRAQEQTAANLNRVHPAEIERNAGVALERVLHGRNNRRSVHTASSTFLLKAAEGSRPLWREVWRGWGEGGARRDKAPFSNGSTVACTEQNASFCYRNIVCFNMQTLRSLF